MWSTLDRTRRRLLRVAESAPGTVGATAGDTPGTDAASRMSRDFVIAIGRPEFDRLGVALQAFLGTAAVRPDTPVLLEAALSDAIAGLGASGSTRVARRPAGLYTPEAWQIHLTAADPVIEMAIRRAIREGVFAA